MKYCVTWNEFFHSWTVEEINAVPYYNKIIRVPESVTGGKKDLIHVYIEADGVVDALTKGYQIIKPSWRNDLGQL